MTEETQPKPKGPPRARWTSAQELKLKSGKDPDSAAVWLVTALVALDMAAGTVDTALSVEAGTTMAYLKTGHDQPGMTTARVDELLLLLAALHGEGAFRAKALDTGLTLRVMLR
jgi:hypothetical protein